MCVLTSHIYYSLVLEKKKTETALNWIKHEVRNKKVEVEKRITITLKVKERAV